MDSNSKILDGTQKHLGARLFAVTNDFLGNVCRGGILRNLNQQRIKQDTDQFTDALALRLEIDLRISVLVEELRNLN